MPGERWPDKRARAVLFAGANRLTKEDPAAAAPDAIADAGLAVRELLFTDAEVREENAESQAHRIGYSADCMQYATLEPSAAGIVLSLWLGADRVAEAKEVLAATEHPNPFRRLYGWVQVPVRPGDDTARLSPWIQHARRHASETKSKQQVSM